MDTEIEDLKCRKGQRRKTQLATGYESDSDGHDLGDDSDDSSKEEGEEEEEHKPESGEKRDVKEDEDDDMFASEDEPEPQPPRQAKPKAGFDIDQFEKEQGLDTYRFDADVDVHKTEAAQEVQLEAFNLREETESGKFDKDMNYVAGKDSSDDEEPWMADASKEAIHRARLAQQKARSQTKHSTSRPMSAILQDLISHLEPAESAMEALGRLRPKKAKRGTKGGSKNLNIAAGEDDASRKKSVMEITECCEQLVNEKGVSSAYDMSREELMRAYSRETGEAFQARGTKRNADEMEGEMEGGMEGGMETKDNDYGEAIWEFRWEGEDAVNGPYSSYEMKYWKETYFEDKVEVRRVGQSDYVHVTRVDFEG